MDVLPRIILWKRSRHMQPSLSGMYVLYVSVCQVQTYIHTHIHTHTYIYIYIDVLPRVLAVSSCGRGQRACSLRCQVCMYICMCLCVKYRHTYTHTHTHTHTYIYMDVLPRVLAVSSCGRGQGT